MDARRAGQAYLALPAGGRGPGVLVLHSWWGLTPFFRDLCDRLAAEGFVALAPDLLAGDRPDSVAEAEEVLARADANELAHLTRSSLQTLRDMPATPGGPVAIVGFSMGASLGLWLSARVTDAIAATVTFYGGQDVDFVDASSAYLGHFSADPDPYLDEDSLVLLEADLHLLGLDTTFHRYPDVGHWFFEADRPEHDAEAAALAWTRTLDFLRQHLTTP